jgi:hypothetical protein
MASNFLDFTDPNDPRFGIDNPYDLYQYYSNPSLTQQTEEENLAPPLTQQTVFNPLTNYFGDDDDEEDVINRTVNTNKNFNSPITMRNALQYGIGALINPILGYAAGKAYDYYNPPRDPYGGLIDFNKQPDYDFGPDGDGVAFGGNEVTAKDAIDTGFGNVRGPDEEFSLIEKMENEGTDGGGEPGGGYDSESETDSGSGTHSDPGD